VDLSGVTVIRPSGTPVEGVRTVTTYPDEVPYFVMLGFKPQKLAEIAPGLSAHVGRATTLVSMLAGVTIEDLRHRFPDAGAIAKIMPNLPVAVGEGVVPILADGETGGVETLMAALGTVVPCQSEQDVAAIGALASAGSAYFARFAEAMGKGGAGQGLDPETAQRLAVQAMLGTAAYARDRNISMAELARRVASPKGTTERGLAVLGAPGGLQALVDRTLEAAVRRGRELAEEVRRG
jgi:pyrroline-5-carboxylate reductase